MLSEVKEDKRRTELRHAFRQCLTKIVTYLQVTLALKSTVLRDLSCLQPKARTTDKGKSAISRLGLHMKKVIKTDEYRDRIQGEWLVYMSYSSIVEVQSDCDGIGNKCLYWEKMSEVSDDVFGKKYACLSFLAKAALTLAHGNAIRERI